MLLLGALIGVLPGCKVTHEDVEYWKRTVKGPGKLVAVLLSDRYEVDLRTHAAVCLVEMERRDVDGVAELGRAMVRLNEADPAAPAVITAGVTDRLIVLMNTVPEPVEGAPDPIPGADVGAAPLQIRAKDSAYMLLEYAQGPARDKLIEAVVRWYAEDFASRSLAGNYSGEQVVRALGAPAAALLVDALSAEMPPQSLVKIAELIGEVGDDAAKARAAERMVEIETYMEGPEFITWMEGEIRKSYEEQEREFDPARVHGTALLTRENFINDGALPAMKFLASQPPLAERLLTIAEAAPPEGTPDALIERIATRRQRALQALEGSATVQQLSRLLDLALNTENPIAIRDYAFDRVGDIGSSEAIDRLWPIFQSADSETMAKRLRWRAGGLILSIGGASLVPQFLQRMPARPGIQYEPEELLGYANRMAEFPEPPTSLLRRQLNSPQWWKRILAARFLETKGDSSDAGRLERLTNDRARVAGEGWSRDDPAIESVGAVVTSSLAALRARLGEASQDNPVTAQ